MPTICYGAARHLYAISRNERENDCMKRKERFLLLLATLLIGTTQALGQTIQVRGGANEKDDPLLVPLYASKIMRAVVPPPA